MGSLPVCGERVESPGLEKVKVSAGCGEEGAEFWPLFLVKHGRNYPSFFFFFNLCQIKVKLAGL